MERSDQAGLEVWRGGVNAWECDFQGHLNVRHYVRKSALGLAAVVAELGLPDAFSPAGPTLLTVREQYVRFLREAPLNAALSMWGAVLDIGPSDARLLLVLHNRSGEPITAFQTVVVNISTADRQPAAWPRGFQERARELLITAPAHAVPRSIDLAPLTTVPTLERAQALGMTRSGLSVVAAEDCDRSGRMRMDAFIGLIGDCTPQMPGRQASEKRGGAAVEYRLAFFDPPRAGERIELRSGIAELTSRHQRAIHWLLDPQSGRAWGAGSNVGVSFDPATRKLAVLSPEEVAAGQAHVLAGIAL